MENKIALAGKLASKVKQKRVYGKDLFAVDLEVIRTSGVIDTLQCIFDSNAVDGEMGEMKPGEIKLGIDVIVYGAVQTYREASGHCPLFVWVEYITFGKAKEQNHVMLEGTVSRRPVYRFTPLGREITDVMLKVSCSVATTEGEREANKDRYCYIPCIVWGRNAKWAENLQKGDKVSLEGRLQSRNYEKEGEIKTTHEVSVQIINKI